MINIIVAITENNAIGKNNELLFHLKGDLKHFKEVTADNIVIMGRKTYESIGKPLPNRINYILTKNSAFKEDIEKDLFVKESLKESIKDAMEKFPDKDIFIIGGGRVYTEAMNCDIVDRLYITKVRETVKDADTFFPYIDYRKDWFINGDVKLLSENGVQYFIFTADRRRENKIKDFLTN